jgi:hypothetical protein
MKNSTGKTQENDSAQPLLVAIADNRSDSETDTAVVSTNPLSPYRLIEYSFPTPTAANTSCFAALGKYGVILVDCGLALWLYLNPSLKYAGKSLPRQILFLSSSLSSNFGVTFWTALKAFDYVANYTQRRKLAALIGYTQNCAQKTAKYLAVIVGGFFTSFAGAAIAMQEGQGALLMRSIEAIGIFCGDLPVNLFGVLNFIEEYVPPIQRTIARIFHHCFGLPILPNDGGAYY